MFNLDAALTAAGVACSALITLSQDVGTHGTSGHFNAIRNSPAVNDH